MDEISLKRFIEEQKQFLQRFETYWIEEQMKDPESETYPDEMRMIDWEEQLELFKEEVG